MRDSKGKDTNNMTKTNPITLFFADEIDTVVHVLKGGGVVLMPTDTIWGLSCLAADPKAVERIQRIKGRTPDKPFILLVDSIEMLKQYVEDLPPRIENLLVYHERPITIVYPKGKNLPPHNIHVDGSVAIRICNEPFCKEVIRRLGQPSNLYLRYAKQISPHPSSIVHRTPFANASQSYRGDLHFPLTIYWTQSVHTTHCR